MNKLQIILASSHTVCICNHAITSNHMQSLAVTVAYVIFKYFRKVEEIHLSVKTGSFFLQNKMVLEPTCFPLNVRAVHYN